MVFSFLVQAPEQHVQYVQSECFCYSEQPISYIVPFFLIDFASE